MTGKKLLFLGNGKARISSARLDLRFASHGLDVETFWAYGNEFPESLDGYSGIFLSGSPHGAYEDVPFIHQEHELIRDAADRGIPMLGICFGHQILASALCGRDQVFRRGQCEVGYKWLDVTSEAQADPVCSHLGAKMHMFVWHNDEVRADHPDMRVLASSDQCPNQVWRYRDRPVWGIQGHPEITLETAEDWFEASRARLEHDGADLDELMRTASEAEDAKLILDRFAGLCRQ
ncbi:MAG: type 1 glutamine amidotransferase [Gluconobacter potus]|uniref:Type 1 glutamine amidotransferase n=1 Tax=Gluconobacter potus TaxID=2724927 RepID=A0ABR9YQ04_9PROT|nr:MULTISPECIES: type 1 glutamine amidotransferase [Gluconobacter]MBF0865835.1 type 1 glutamine amidotransferase [Gluconobacter sp. R71656]MBF0868953.1 type 1 glutamine amidotransferase [Gluconobacter sp. R75628]MBF0874937.1 type 1 glutamine amidotransferase [Gluconobacter sp. R75629]MBF0883866.1 type 1 glutamine amidotransferase [Gluconobacter potus]